MLDYEMVVNYKKTENSEVLIQLWDKYKPGIENLAYKMKERINDPAISRDDCLSEIYLAMYKAMDYIDLKKVKCRKERFNFFGVLRNYAMIFEKSSYIKHERADINIERNCRSLESVRFNDTGHLSVVYETIRENFEKNLAKRDRIIFDSLHQKKVKKKDIAKKLKIDPALYTYYKNKIEKRFKVFAKFYLKDYCY